jgi:ribonuclease P protein component
MQRHLRLRRKEDFARLRAAGRVWRHPFLTLSVTPNGLPHNRYGFIVGKRLGKAVVRNRVRRALREVARQAHPHLAQGHDMAFIARSPMVGQSYQAVTEVTMTLFARAGLWVSERTE